MTSTLLPDRSGLSVQITATEGTSPTLAAHMLCDAVHACFLISATAEPGEDGRILAACCDAAHVLLARVRLSFAGFACEVDDGNECACDRGGTAFSASSEGRGGNCKRSGSRSACSTAAAAAEAPLCHVFGVEFAIAAAATATLGTGGFFGTIITIALHACEVRIISTHTTRTARSCANGVRRDYGRCRKGHVQQNRKFGHLLVEPCN